MTEEALAAWMRSEMKRTGTKGVELVEVLGLAQARISEMSNGKRGISAVEYIKLRRHFKSVGGPLEIFAPVPGGVAGLPIMGRIGMKTWAESESDCPMGMAPVGVLADQRYPLDEQGVYILDSGSADGKFNAGDYVVTVPYDGHRTAPKPGDVLVLKRRRDTDLHRFLLARAERTDAGIRLVAVLDSDTSVEQPTKHDEILRLVIGLFSPFS